MTSLLYINDDDTLKKVNIDDLYEKKKMRDLKQISIFNKILNRIHKRITITGRTKKNEKHIWFSIPEYIFGEPVYDKGECIGYIVQKLEENGFFIKYICPNTLFISWENWVPTYVRNEIKKKRGILIDEKGNFLGEVDKNKQNDMNGMGVVNNGGFSNDDIYSSSKMSSSSSNNKSSSNGLDGNGNEGKKYNPISNYKPNGNLVYNQEIFEKLEKKIVF